MKLSILICTVLLVGTGVNAQKKGTKKTPAKSTPSKTTQKPINKQVAQQTDEEKFRFGIRVGGNVAKITGDDKTRIFTERIGYFGGVVARYSITNKINIQSEAYYNLLGTSSKNKDNFSVKGRVNMSYISVPILGQYEITPRFYAETGPEFSFHLSSNLKDLETKKIYNWKDYTKKISFAWAIGTGYYVTDNLGVNLRANIGLSSPFLDESTTFKADHFRHVNFQLGMIYLF